MALKRLPEFQYFSINDFLDGKQIVFVKSIPWFEGKDKVKTLEGCKVVVQIVRDETSYSQEEHSHCNFGESFEVKVRGTSPASYQKFKPFSTEVVIEDVEKASIWGDYSNNLSIIATVKARGTQ